MRVLLICLIAFMTLSQAFDFDPGPAPGLKIRNALVYLLLLGLLSRFTIDRSYRIQAPVIPALFAAVIGYAILTYVAVLLVIDYPHYDAITTGMSLKTALIDQLLLFLVFFYGCRSDEDALLILKVLLAFWALAHVVAVLDALGVVQIGDIRLRRDGRVQGTIGESNQYGAFVALSLPAMVALFATTRHVWRLFWLLAALATAAALVMTVSRGAYVATALAAVCGLLMFRRYVPTGRLLVWAGGALVIAALVIVTVMALGFGDLLYVRLFDTGGSLERASSGRTQVWATAIAVMFEHPITLLTGFGWGAYQSMPFRFATHNHYLDLWFNLGLPGLICGILLFVVPARIARRAFTVASPTVRPMLAAFVVAVIVVATAVFFVNLYSPWHYYWAYVGVIMRLAVNAGTETATSAAPVHVPRLAPTASDRDSHGWTAASSR
jgi:O-antigen ligase